MAVDEIRRAAESCTNIRSCAAISASSALRSSSRRRARTSIVPSEGNAPSRSGVKPSLSGWNGADKRQMQADRDARAVALQER